MSYFDGLTDGVFKTTPKGKSLFYPWGVLGKGYVLPDDSKKQELRKFISLWYKISLPAIFGIGVGIGWIFTLVVLSFVFSWYYFTTRRLLKGLFTTGTRLTLRESYTNSAKSHTTASLGFLLALSILFILAGLWVLFVTKEERITGSENFFIDGRMIRR